MTRVDFLQVRCPTALTNKTRCLCNDEFVQLSLDSPVSSPYPSQTNPPPMSYSPKASTINTGSIAAITLAGLLFLLITALTGCWIVRRRRRLMNRSMNKDDNTLSSDLSRATSLKDNHSELATRKENSDLRIHELFPIHILEADSTGVHQSNATELNRLGRERCVRSLEDKRRFQQLMSQSLCQRH